MERLDLIKDDTNNEPLKAENGVEAARPGEAASEKAGLVSTLAVMRAKKAPNHLTRADVTALQGAIGNRAVTRILQKVGPALKKAREAAKVESETRGQAILQRARITIPTLSSEEYNTLDASDMSKLFKDLHEFKNDKDILDEAFQAFSSAVAEASAATKVAEQAVLDRFIADFPQYKKLQKSEEPVLLPSPLLSQSAGVGTSKSVDDCKAIGETAIKYARAFVPRAGNQVVDLDATEDYAYLNYTAAKEITTKFKAKLKEQGIVIVAHVHPFIRAEIARLTGGGLCGEYAALVYTFFKNHHPNIPVRIVHAADFGNHAWVEITASNGAKLVVDPWPSIKRDVVPVEEFFAKEGTGEGKSREASAFKEYKSAVETDLAVQERHLDEVKKIWTAFIPEAITIAQQELAKEPEVKLEPFNVTSTRKEPRSMTRGAIK